MEGRFGWPRALPRKTGREIQPAIAVAAPFCKGRTILRLLARFPSHKTGLTKKGHTQVYRGTSSYPAMKMRLVAVEPGMYSGPSNFAATRMSNVLPMKAG